MAADGRWCFQRRSLTGLTRSTRHLWRSPVGWTTRSIKLTSRRAGSLSPIVECESAVAPGALHKAIGDGVVAGPGSTVCAERYAQSSIKTLSQKEGGFSLPVVGFVVQIGGHGLRGPPSIS